MNKAIEMMMHRGTGFALMVMAGCSQPNLRDLEVTEARIDNMKFSSIKFYLGWMWTKGTLEIDDSYGDTYRYPISLSGPLLGVDMGFSFGYQWNDNIPATNLYLPEGEVWGNELLGEYGGVTAGAALGVGTSLHELINRHGTRIEDFDQTLGLEISASVQALYLRAKGNDYSMIGEDME